MPYPVVPEYITVHLGAPDAPAENVTLSFPNYIKNVAASELYPTWNENALRANILAQISVALNRVYTEFYRSRGYDFDITSDTQYDQAFVPGRATFENINAIVDDIFNDYIVRRGNIEPLYAQFCDGVRTQCRGLSQWGSQELAQQGRTPYEILQYYYGQDIDLVYNAPVGDSTPSYPGRPLTVGSVGEDVRTIQRELNRIRNLKREKYDTWEWNYGKSPKYDMTNRRRWSGGGLEVRAQIEEGRICALVFYGDFLAMRPLEDITSALEGCLMRREDVAAVLDGFPLNEYFGGISRQELLDTIFSA